MTPLQDKLDEILAKLSQYNLGDDPITDEPFTAEETMAIYPELKEATQAILTALEAWVTSAMPEKRKIGQHERPLGDAQNWNEALDQYHTNLIDSLKSDKGEK